MPPLHLPLLVRMAVLSMALASTGSMARSADSSATQPATAPAAAPAADVERLLSPFVDDTTLAVLRVDVSKLQWDVLRDWSIKLLSDSGLPEVDRKRADAAIVDGCARAKMWSEAFVKAGGAHIYLVGNFNTLAPVYGLVPLQNGADAERITGMLRQIGLANGINPFAEKTGAIEVRRQGDLLVSGPPNAVQSALDMAGDPKRTKRSDLAVALAAGGDAALVLAFSPTAEQKEALATNEPKLPEALGGGSTAEAVADFTYAALWATVPQAQSPSADLRIRIKAKDAAAAARLKFLMLRLIASMQGHDGDKPNVLELATLFKSELVDDHIEITLNQAGMEGVAKVVAALFIQSREVAMHYQAMMQMRALALTIFRYAEEHDGALPNNLQADLAKYIGDEAAVRAALTNPRYPDRFPGFVYVKPAAKLSEVRDPATTIILYEAYDVWPASGLTAVYADGHGERVDEADIKKR